MKKWANLVILVIFLVAERGHSGGRIGHASPHEGDEIGKQKTKNLVVLRGGGLLFTHTQ